MSGRFALASCLTLILLGGLCAEATWAQFGPLEPWIWESGNEASSSNVWKLEGDELPEYVRVQEFLLVVASWARDRHPGHLANLLRDLGMDPAGKPAELLIDAAFKTEVLADRPTVDLSLEGEEFMDFQLEALEEKAEDLGELYADLLSGLESTGYPIERLRENTVTRINSTLSSSEGPPNPRILESLQAFERTLAERGY